MRISTIVSLGVSATLGLGALVVARIWLPAHSPGATHPAAAIKTVSVVVATSPIAYGAKLQPKDLAVLQIPADAAPQGAFASVDQVLKQDAGAPPVALVAMSAREPVLISKLSGAGKRPTVAAMISEGMRAYTIGVSDTAGGGGHVMPGDHVDVVLTRDASGQPTIGVAQGSHLVSDVVIQNARVLGMDLNADPTSTHPAVAHTATLEVTVQDAERLALAAQAGGLSLALRRAGSGSVEFIRPMRISDLEPGAARPSRADGLSPARLRSASSHAGTPGRLASVVVVHGDERTSVKVPAYRRGDGV